MIALASASVSDDGGMTIETVRGSLSDETAAEILAFWEGRGALSGNSAKQRLREVVCVLRDSDGAITGVNSVYAKEVPLVGNRVFWVYRSLLDSAGSESWIDMVRGAFEALAEKFDPEAGGPVGICVLISDGEEMRRRPEAEWTDPRLLYAGYSQDGSQVRIGYFPGARI